MSPLVNLWTLSSPWMTDLTVTNPIARKRGIAKITRDGTIWSRLFVETLEVSIAKAPVFRLRCGKHFADFSACRSTCEVGDPQQSEECGRQSPQEIGWASVRFSRGSDGWPDHFIGYLNGRLISQNAVEDIAQTVGLFFVWWEITVVWNEWWIIEWKGFTFGGLVIKY